MKDALNGALHRIRIKRAATGGNKGFALIIALLVTAVLVIVVAEVVNSVHMSIFSVGSKKDGQRAAILAEGGVELASRAIPELNKGKNYTYFSREDSVRVVPVGDGVLTIRIEDEQAKLNPNLLVLPNGEINGDAYAAYERFIRALKFRRSLVDAAADWIDKDDTPRAEGAESYDYYKGLRPPYTVKNSPLASVDELRLVKGYDAAAFGIIGKNITIYTDGKLNINTASKEALMSLSADMTAEMADRIVEYRLKKPFEDTAEIRKVSGLDTVGFAVQGRIVVSSRVFRVFSRAAVGDAVREAESVVDISGDRKILYWRQR